MATHILAVNAGSSSLKCRLFKPSASGQSDPELLARVKVDRLNQSGGPEVKFEPEPELEPEADRRSHKERDMSSHENAFAYVLDVLREQHAPKKDDKEGWTGLVVAHRVVHGGQYEKPVEVSKEVLHELERLEGLAPLHNAPAVSIIRKCLDSIPSVTNVAFFDSAFHATIPEHVRTYAIDPESARARGLRKYGFHGISYQYIVREMAGFLGKAPSDVNLIVMHLGSGASVCAIKGGRSIDTSMGLTPTSGLPGATRSGDVDPSLIFHFMSSASNETESSGVRITEAELVLNKQSGWKALAGTSDFSEIATPEASGSARLALDLFVDRIVNFVGAYYVKLGGSVDGLVFSGGIGESSAMLRAEVVRHLGCLGFALDDGAQETVNSASASGSRERTAKRIGSKGDTSKGGVFVCCTNEELEMARGVDKGKGDSTGK